MHKCVFSEEVSVCISSVNQTEINLQFSLPSLLCLPHSSSCLLPNTAALPIWLAASFSFFASLLIWFSIPLCLGFSFFNSSLESFCLVHLERSPLLSSTPTSSRVSEYLFHSQEHIEMQLLDRTETSPPSPVPLPQSPSSSSQGSMLSR